MTYERSTRSGLVQLGYLVDGSTISIRLRSMLGKPDYLVAVACKAKRIAGWVQAHASTALESGARVEIVGLVVSAEVRRRGIGHLLVDFVERWAATVSAETVVVRSNVARDESHAFYPALGYTRTKTQAVYRKLAPKRHKQPQKD